MVVIDKSIILILHHSAPVITLNHEHSVIGKKFCHSFHYAIKVVNVSNTIIPANYFSPPPIPRYMFCESFIERGRKGWDSVRQRSYHHIRRRVNPQHWLTPPLKQL